MNPVLLIAHNNLNFTIQAVASIFRQDIPVTLFFVDNASTDGTAEWLKAMQASAPHKIIAYSNEQNVSPIKVCNRIYREAFSMGAQHILTPNTDQILPDNCYREMLKWPRGFVCATDVGRTTPEVRESRPVSENTPFGLILIRKWAYDALVAEAGYFYDENYFLYASDCDLAVRMAACGIRGIQVDTPFYHYGSATLAFAPPEEKRKIELLADGDRAYFEKKHGFPVTALEYGIRARDPFFERKA